MSTLIMTEAAIPGYTEGVPLHTDDNALLEYSAPKALLLDRSTVILEALYAHRQNPVSVLRAGESVEIPTAMERELLKRFEARKDVLAGFTSYTKGAAQEAIERFEHALAKSPQDYDATYLLAKLYYEIGNRFRDKKRPAEATMAYEKSVEAVDNFISGNRALLADHFKLDVTYSRANLYLGTLALEADRLERAAAAFEKSISGEVQYADAHNNMGIVYERTGEYEAALNHYQLAIELNPNLVSAYMNMGNALIKQKRYGEAIESYRQVEKLRPDFALTHYNLGVAYFQQNQWARAEEEWERALELKPDFSQAQKSLNGVHDKIKSHRLTVVAPGSVRK
jgi:tetratricopeptide (TPR) repeat protein